MTAHFVRDYQRWVDFLLDHEPSREAAMARAVGGGDYVTLGRDERDILLSNGLRDGDFVIDVGCGSGRLAASLDATGPSVRYLGIDVVSALINYAKERCVNHPDWCFVAVQGLTIPENDGVADVVVFFSVLTHLSPSEGFAYLEDAKRVLRKNGKIIVSYLDPRDLPLSFLIRFFCSQAAWRLLGRGVKGTLCRKAKMREMAAKLGLEVRFIERPSIGQSIAVFSRPIS